jgi:arsenite methyltransferase
VDKRLLDLLIDPKTKEQLIFQADPSRSSDGELADATGNRYPVRDGIPRFADAEFEPQTAGSFSYKWHRQSAYEDDSVVAMIEHDEPPRWGFRTIDEFRDLFRGPKTILDAGCGSAHFASTYVPSVNTTNKLWVGMDLTTAIDIARKRFQHLPNVQLVQGNLLEVPFKDNIFDTILCRGVMHHTPDQWRAFRNLSRILKHGGEFCFLIYRKMGPIREFTDTFIRNEVSKLSPDQAWEALRPLTEFGKSLADSEAMIDVPKDIPYLEIPAGRYRLHELIYDHFLKAFWSKDQGLRSEYVYDYSQHNTFDWYHPKYATKATAEEIRNHAEAEGLEVTHLKDLYTSWAVRCRKP